MIFGSCGSDVGHFGADLGRWFPNHSFMNENVDKTADKWGAEHEDLARMGPSY